MGLVTNNCVSSSCQKPKKLNNSLNIGGDDSPLACKVINYYTSTSVSIDMSDAAVGTQCIVFWRYTWSTVSTYGVTDTEFWDPRVGVAGYTGDGFAGYQWKCTVNAGVKQNGLVMTDNNSSARKSLYVIYWREGNIIRGDIYADDVVQQNAANASKYLQRPANTYQESAKGDILILTQSNAADSYNSLDDAGHTDWTIVTGASTRVCVRYRYLDDTLDYPYNVTSRNVYVDAYTSSLGAFSSIVRIKNPFGLIQL